MISPALTGEHNPKCGAVGNRLDSQQTEVVCIAAGLDLGTTPLLQRHSESAGIKFFPKRRGGTASQGEVFST
jgi:hypothetical protein